MDDGCVTFRCKLSWRYSGARTQLQGSLYYPSLFLPRNPSLLFFSLFFILMYKSWLHCSSSLFGTEMPTPPPKSSIRFHSANRKRTPATTLLSIPIPRSSSMRLLRQHIGSICSRQLNESSLLSSLFRPPPSPATIRLVISSLSLPLPPSFTDEPRPFCPLGL